MKRYLALLFAMLLMASLLWGCGANSASDSASAEIGNGYVESESIADAGLSQSSEGTGTASAPQNQKLIRKVWLDAETEDLDALLSQVEQRISEFSGYIEARDVYNGSNYTSHRYRYANLTIRIPAEQVDAFINQVSESSNIVSTEETVDDVTLSYVATESRITALETEQTRLLELLEKAESMDDILQIESRLTDVRSELEEVTSQLRLYDNQVSYGTIYLNIEEVREYTVVEEPVTMWERMGSGFMESLENLGDGIVELLIFLVSALPYLVPIAVIITAAVLIIKLHRKRKNHSQKEDQTQN